MSSLQSLDRALDILILLSESEEKLGVSEIARRLDAHKSTIHRAVMTLANRGFLSKEEPSSLYSLGERSLLLGFSAAKSHPISQAARPHMSFLSQKYGAKLFLSIFKGGNLCVINNFMGDSYPSLLTWDQSRANVTAYRPSIVYCMLAYNSRLDVNSPELNSVRLMDDYVLRMVRQKSRYKGPSSIEEVVAHLKEIKQNGYAKELNEYYPDEISYAFPVYNSDNKVFATLCIVTSKQKMLAYSEPQLLSDMKHAADDISGFQADKAD